jgi:hypothetical protein
MKNKLVDLILYIGVKYLRLIIVSIYKKLVFWGLSIIEFKILKNWEEIVGIS